MRSPGGFGAAAAALLLALPFTSAFVPSTPLARAASSHTAPGCANAFLGVAGTSSPVRRPSSPSSALKMVDQNTIIGAGVAFAGLAVGAGMVAFTEAQGERTAERGAISSDRRSKMQAMFMEDDVVQTTDVDDVRSNMRRALRANQTEEELLALTADARKKAEEEADDGW